MENKRERMDQFHDPTDSRIPITYRGLGTFRSDEIVIRRSRFIGWGAPVDTEDDALAVLERIRSEHPQATHHCYAYRVGLGTETVRFSDDGEPGGTAGKPILEVLNREDLRNAIVVVTRYFGGVQLGAGGLVRAYAQSAKMAIDAAGIVEQVRHARLSVVLDYEWVGRVQHELQERGAVIETSDYGEQVSLSVLVRVGDVARITAQVQELTNGQTNPEVINEVYRAIPVHATGTIGADTGAPTDG